MIMAGTSHRWHAERMHEGPNVQHHVHKDNLLLLLVAYSCFWQLLALGLVLQIVLAQVIKEGF